MAYPSSFSPPHHPHPNSPPNSLHLSPSKFRAHQETSRAWSQVDSWLTSLHSSTPTAHPTSTPTPRHTPTPTLTPAPAHAPSFTFERNTSTLAYLQQLMHCTTNADETRRLLHNARVEEVEGLKRNLSQQRGDAGNRFNSTFQAAMTQLQDQLVDPLQTSEISKIATFGSAAEALDDLVASSLLLGYPTLSLPLHTGASTENASELASVSLSVPEILAQMTHDLTAKIFQLEDRVMSLNGMYAEIEDATVETQRAIEDVGESRTDVDVEMMHQQAAQWARETKTVNTKAKEYEERIAALERVVAGDSIVEELRAQEDQKKMLLNEIEELQMDLVEFNGLPPDIAASRQELRRVQSELDNLKQKRDRAFASMRDR